MKNDEFNNIWSDNRNWKWGLFYNCPKDPRVIVPKRPMWAGRTLNFAHKKAYVVLLITIIIILIPIIIDAISNLFTSTVLSSILIVEIIAITIFYYATDLKVK